VIKRILSRLSQGGIPGFHTLIMDRPLPDFEVATMILSIRAYQKNIGDITLFADEAGMKWAVQNKIAHLYNDTKQISVDETIDRKKFWAAGKLEAWSRMKAPCVSVDIDAVLYKKPSVFSDIVALHPEPPEWDVYGPSALRMSVNKMTDMMYSERVQHPPANVGILCINDEGFRLNYTHSALSLMRMESLWPIMSDDEAITINGVPITQMVLAEQYMLSSLATASGRSMSFISDLDVKANHMVPTKKAFHLWNSKRFYQQHARAREVYISRVLEELYTMGAMEDRAVANAVFVNGLPSVRVVDANTGKARWSYNGEWTGPGETFKNFGYAN